MTGKRVTTGYERSWPMLSVREVRERYEMSERTPEELKKMRL